MKIEYVSEWLSVLGQSQLSSLAFVTASETSKTFVGNEIPENAVYYIWSDQDCFFLVRPAGVTTPLASNSTGVLMLAKNPMSVEIPLGANLAVRGDTAAGTLRMIRQARLDF